MHLWVDMNTKGIDFDRLDLRDALDLAVLIEEEARDRYEELAEQMALHHTRDAARFFLFMQRNEERHRAELAGRRETLFGQQPVTVHREMIFDVEAPDYDEVRAGMPMRCAFALALHSEQRAWGFFDQLVSRLTDPAVRQLFEELRAAEVQHQDLVRREMERLPPDRPSDGSPFEDEPVAQD